MPNIFEQLRERVSLADAISFLGLTVKQEKPGQFRSVCPACKGSDKRDLSINTEKGFTCFRANKRGNDAVSLVAHCRGISQGDAAKELAEHFLSAPRGSSPAPTAKLEEEAGMEPLSYLDVTHPTIELLGLSQTAAEGIGIGFAVRGTMVGRVCIPLRLPSGELVGYCGLATREDMEPLLLFPRNLDEKVKPPEPDRQPADELRKLWRVVK